MNELENTADSVRQQGQDTVGVGYTKDEPVKAMLMATAAGALLMGLVTMIPLA